MKPTEGPVLGKSLLRQIRTKNQSNTTKKCRCMELGRWWMMSVTYKSSRGRWISRRIIIHHHIIMAPQTRRLTLSASSRYRIQHIADLYSTCFDTKNFASFPGPLEFRTYTTVISLRRTNRPVFTSATKCFSCIVRTSVYITPAH